MEKNPISFLQEHMAKNKFSMPKYTTIEEHNGTHINHFVIKVESGEYSATGEGSSKKEARTNAAIKMLALLNLNSKKIITKNSALSDHQLNSKSTSIQDNYVGKLQEIAVSEGHLCPDYSKCTASGPPHNPEFTVTCKYQGYKEEGIGKTKKEAKNRAAQQMYKKFSKESKIADHSSKLENYLKSFTDDMSQLKVCSNHETIMKESSEKAVKTYSTLTKMELIKPVIDTKKTFHEYYLNLKSSLTYNEHNLVINELIDISNACKKFSPNTLTKLENILKNLNINLKVIQFDSKKNGAVYGLQLNTNPVISEIGLGLTEEEAETSAVVEIAKTLLLMLV